MKGIVTVKLQRNQTTGRPDREAPFLVLSDMTGRSGFYLDEPNVLAQMLPDEIEARFEAEWIDGDWKLGRRVQDA